MLKLLADKMQNGPVHASIMAVGGNAQVSLKVQIESCDEVGIVCRVKGMMGGWGEPQLRPWACIAHVMFIE